MVAIDISSLDGVACIPARRFGTMKPCKQGMSAGS
jgi:hypothetical protein